MRGRARANKRERRRGLEEAWDNARGGELGLWMCCRLGAPGCDSRPIGGITSDPNGEWMKQVARNLTDMWDGFLLGKRYLIHDRDPLFTEAVRGLLRDSGVKPLRLPANSPNLNAYAERFVLSIRRECLDRFVPLSERHLRTAVTEYVVHYHRCLCCLLLVMCTYPFVKKALTLHLPCGEGRERYFGCNLMQRKVLASSHQHLMAEAPHRTGSEVSPAARNILASARIPRASKLLICGLFQKGRVLAQDGVCQQFP